MSNQPTFDMTMLGETAVVAHELFRSYVAAGFTEDQAIRLLAAYMVACGQAGGAA